MPSAAQLAKLKEQGRCLMCGKERDGAGERCTSCQEVRAIAVTKNRAKRKNLSFSLEKGWLAANTPEHCPCCSIKMERGGEQGTSPSIDRMDNSRGYEPDNCWVICFSCNEAKSSSPSPAELLQQAERMLRVARVWSTRCSSEASAIA